MIVLTNKNHGFHHQRLRGEIVGKIKTKLAGEKTFQEGMASIKIGDGFWQCVYVITKHGHHRKYKTTRVALAEKFIKYQKTQKIYFLKKPGGTITAYGGSGSSYDDNGAAISWWVVH
jgi:hypothetical protein